MQGTNAYLVDGTRTPFLRAGTGFRDLMSYQLGAAAIRGLLDKAGLDAGAVDRVLIGATVSNPRATNVAREAALEAGLPPTVPAVTVTAAGASATAAVEWGLDLIATGKADVVVAGGSDCVSDPPIGYSREMRTKLLDARRLRGLGDKLRFLARLRPWDFLPDMPGVTELSTGQTMGEYTEDLAQRLGIRRQDQDEFAARSHHLAAAAASHLAEEIVPVDGVADREDNGVRPETSVEALARLKPSFAKDGTLTAGNSTFLTDGAAVVLLMSEKGLREHLPERTPKAVFRSAQLIALDLHEELLLGPVTAMPRALKAAGIDFADVDVYELHEAFAAQVLAVTQLLVDAGHPELPLAKLNAWGGSLAIGNPFAPNGARLLTTAANRLGAESGRYALIGTCAGGALGHSFIIERYG